MNIFTIQKIFIKKIFQQKAEVSHDPLGGKTGQKVPALITSTMKQAVLSHEEEK